MPAKSLTRSGPPRLSEVAQHLHVPVDIVSTGWPAVRKTCTEKLGVAFDPWQDQTGRIILAKRADGHLAAMIDGVGMSLPRQVGKTHLVAALVFALCINTPRLLVIWTAHHSRTHGETFLALQAFADRPRVRAHVRQVFTGSGDEEIRFNNGSRILFGARERGFGRGVPGVDVLIFDEAQILSDKAMANMVATLNTSQFGLQLYIGTPPKPDDMAEAFTRMRDEALRKTLLDGAWIELGAEPGAKPDDRAQWRRANPSYPRRTPAQSIIRLKRKLTPPDFMREGLGVWDDDAAGFRVIAREIWDSRADRSGSPAPHVGPVWLGVDSDPDRERTSIVAAGSRKIGPPLIEVTSDSDGIADNRPGVDWALDRLVAIVGKGGVAGVVIDEFSQAATLIRPLRRAGVRVVVTNSRKMAQACGEFFTAVVETGEVTHLDDALFMAALRGAVQRNLSDAWGWNRRKSGDDITPLVAATLALWAHRNIRAGEFVAPGRLG